MHTVCSTLAVATIATAAAILVSLPVVAVFLAVSRYLTSGLTLGAVKE